MTFTEREALYFPILVAAFLRHNLPPEWGPAIARQESSFMAGVKNDSAGDATRGGSWGLCQMSWLTAKSLGFKGNIQQLTDPAINAELAATLCEEISKRLKTRELGDIASAYNSGKPLAKAPASTRTVYVPRVLTYAMAYEPRAKDTAAKLKAAGSAPPNAPAPSQLPLPGVAPIAIRGGD